MGKGKTYLERRWPNTPEFSRMLRTWNQSGSTVLLRLVWEGYDKLYADTSKGLPARRDDEELERSITQMLCLRIRDAMTRYEPFIVEHGPYETATRRPAPAQPPEYDIAFVWRSNPRVMWPLEAKVLKTDGTVAEYVKEIRGNYLTCRYAPFSSEGAMLGYLVEGLPATAFDKIASGLNCTFQHHPDFTERNHKTSMHTRKVPKGKPYPARFCCHHLIMLVGPRND